MSSQTPRPPGRRAPRQLEPEYSYPQIPEPKQGHTGHLLAFASVLAVLGFGFWTALATLGVVAEKGGPRALPTGGPTRTATATAPASPTSAAASPAGTPARSATPTPGPGGSRVHVIGQGDTLYRIAQLYGTTVEAIMAANSFTDRSRILHIGERLTIP